MSNLLSGQKITPARSRGFQAGSAAWSTSASTTSGNQTTTFPTAFAAAPSVVAQVVSGAGAAIRSTVLVLSVTATQFQWRVDLNAAATTSGSIHWIAAEQ